MSNINIFSGSYIFKSHILVREGHFKQLIEWKRCGVLGCGGFVSEHVRM